MGGFAWVTLATNDSYSLGALVLAHSLRRAGTPHDLVALVTPGVSQTMRNQLSTIFTLVQEVNVLDSKDEANLALLERPDLGITFTKLHCWRLTQYEKCVFLDADTLVLKNSDELFEREELSAAPDPGWPDCFNSGVFVYRPSQDTFNAIIKFALTKGSFDGGDQGLLNMFFSDWATKDISKHLPFIYNMVSTATYSYLPAYKQFGESAKIVHFIGANKPWLQYFDSESKVARSPSGSEHMQPLLQLWWDIFCSTVHPSLSPDMAARTTFEQPAYTATPTVSHFIIDLLQKFQPMSIYSEYQPVSITPYAEDPSLGFWDPWESYIEHNDSSHIEPHITPWEYHGSDQQKKAFIHDDRQSGWKRHVEIQQEPQHQQETQHHVHPHHQHHHVEHHHQQHHVEHHHQQHHVEHHHQQHVEHYHQEPQHHHYHEPQHHQQQHHGNQHHHHHEPQHHHHHSQHHHQHHHEPQHHHQHYHEPKHHQHYEPVHQSYQQHHEPHSQSHHQHHEPHHHYQYHEPQPQHNQHHEHHHHHETQHHHHEHQHDHHQNHHESQHHYHQHHEQPPQHHNNKPHDEYQIYNVPPPPWESQNKHEHRGESHDHNHHPDPSSTSQANSNINSQYVKVANETECSVDEPSMEDDPSRTADDGLGLAGALAQLTLGVPRTAEQTAFEEHMRRQAWEQGNMDYMGRDSFDNIWRKITETLAEAPTKPATEEVPPTQPASEPKLPESKPPAPKSRKSPPADTSEVPGLSSSVEPTTNQISQVTETPLEGKSIEPSPLASSDIPPPKSASESAKPMPLAPHTPSIIEATPPTSPPIGIPSAPLADIQALKVEATPPETPPVGSSLSEQLKTTQTTESHEQTLSISKDLNIQQSSPAPECPNKKPPPVEKKEQSDRLEQVETFSQEVPALKEITSSLVSTPTEVPASLLEKETPAASSVSQIPSTQETSVLGDVPLPKDEVTVETTGQTDSSISPIPKDEVTVKTTGQTDSSIPPSVHKTEISISQSTDAKNVPSPCVVEVKLPAEQIVPISQLTDEVKVPSSGTADAQPAIGKDVPVEQISSAITEVKPVLDVTVSQQVGEPQIPTEVKSPADKDVVSQNVVEPLSQASPLPGVKPTIEKEVPVAQQAETPTLPSSVTEVPVENVIPNSQQIAEKQIPTSNVTQVKSSLEEVVQIPQQVTDPQIPASAAVEVKPSEKEVSVSPSGEIGSSPVSSPTSNNETQVSKSQTNEKSVPEDSNAQTASAPVVKTKEETVKPAGKKPSVELKTASVESTQSAQVPKSPPSKPSAPVSTPSTPDVPPSDQAPIPPKRRGHKSGGTAAASEQGAASKPATQPQAQQSKGSKGHKGKK